MSLFAPLTVSSGGLSADRQAQQVLLDEAADVVLLGRALLHDRYWQLRAAAGLGEPAPWPVRYERAGSLLPAVRPTGR